MFHRLKITRVYFLHGKFIHKVPVLDVSLGRKLYTHAYLEVHKVVNNRM